jgi:hypothetical protein
LRKKKAARIVSLISFGVVLTIMLVSGFYMLVSQSNIKVKDFPIYKESILKKYDYVKNIGYFNHRTTYFTVEIDTKRELSWDEMKGIYLDTRKFLLTESVQNDLKAFYEKRNENSGNFYQLGIRFDGKSNVRITGSNLSITKGSDTWSYQNYENESSVITKIVTKDGELISVK